VGDSTGDSSGGDDFVDAEGVGVTDADDFGDVIGPTAAFGASSGSAPHAVRVTRRRPVTAAARAPAPL